MGILSKPIFLHGKEVTMHDLFFIKEGGRAVHTGTGVDMSNSCSKPRLICVSHQNENFWIGNYAEGVGAYNIYFDKRDCRKAHRKEVKMYMKGEKITF